MSLETLIVSYGYPVLFFGAMLEGETVLLLGAYLAHEGYLDLKWVTLTTLAGTLVIDQCYFYLGRTKGGRLLARRPNWSRRAARVQALLMRYQLPVALGFRFLYGLRMLTPFVMGMAGFSRSRFLLYNLVGGIVWALTVTLAGYTLGHAAEVFLRDSRRYQLWLLGGVALAGLLFWLHRLWVRRHDPDDIL